MNNPNFNNFEQADIVRDIGEIETILLDYGYARNAQQLRDIDNRARGKISEIQRKDMAVYVSTAPKPGDSGVPWSEVTTSALYSILHKINAYLKTKLTAKLGEDHHANLSQ